MGLLFKSSVKYSKQCAVMDYSSGNLDDPLNGATVANSRRHGSWLGQFVSKTPATTGIHWGQNQFPPSTQFTYKFDDGGSGWGGFWGNLEGY